MPTLYRTKSGIFYIVTCVKGKRVWRSTRTSEKRKANAIFIQSQLPTPVKPTNERTLSDCISEYLPHVKANLSPKTYVIYAPALKRFLASIGDLQVSSISPRHIDGYKVERAATVAPASVNIELRAIKSFFNTLKRWEIIDRSPGESVRQIPIPDVTPAFFSEEELKRLIDAITEMWLKDIVIFASMTGARIGEVLNLTWNDVNVAEHTITIRSSVNYRVKGGRMRTIPMNKTVFDLLEKMQSKEGLIFRGKRGERANPNFVSERFRCAVREGGFDRRLHFHSLRHTFASLLVKKRVSLYQVQRLLGHTTSQMTEKYAHLQCTQMQDVVDEIVL